MARLLYDLTGLLHWYAYFRRPAGVQRVIEKVGACAALQAAAPTSVEFVVRLLGSDGFRRLDPARLVELGDDRAPAVAHLRRSFAQSLRAAPLAGLVAEARYFHLPYLALGLLRTGSPRLPEVEPPGRHDAYFNPGDLWWQKGYAAALGGLKRRTGVRLVQMIHDLYVDQRPDWSPPGFSAVFSRQLRQIAPEVDHWLTSSNFVKAELARRLQEWSVPERPITTIPMGWDSFAPAGDSSGDSAGACHADRAILARHGVGRRPYMLFVGTIEPRKNVGALLDAVDALRAERAERMPDLVLVGSYGWGDAGLRRRLEEGVKTGRLVWARNLGDGELAAFYRGASFTVMPSLGEGWGLAVQESLAHGVPCLASSGGATREAGRDLATYFEPGRPDALAAALAGWIDDAALPAAARARIGAALKAGELPTWNDAGRLLLSLMP